MKLCKRIIIALFSVAFIMLFIAIADSFIKSEQLKMSDIITQSTSPNGEYTIKAFLINGGATTDFAVRCILVNNKTEHHKDLYFQYHCNSADITWLSDDIVQINNQILNTKNESYHYRHGIQKG